MHLQPFLLEWDLDWHWELYSLQFWQQLSEVKEESNEQRFNQPRGFEKEV